MNNSSVEVIIKVFCCVNLLFHAVVAIVKGGQQKNAESAIVFRGEAITVLCVDEKLGL
jgi:hypothetical protein